jgi:hypothetical protein
MENIKKGQTILLTSGSYSDYSADGLYLAMQDITKADCDSILRELASYESLADALVSQGKLKRIDCVEVRVVGKKASFYDSLSDVPDYIGCNRH